MLGLCLWAVSMGTVLHRLEVGFVCLCEWTISSSMRLRVCVRFEEGVAVICDGEP